MRTSSAWLSHVARYRASHPDTPASRVFRDASATYQAPSTRRAPTLSARPHEPSSRAAAPPPPPPPPHSHTLPRGTPVQVVATATIGGKLHGLVRSDVWLPSDSLRPATPAEVRRATSRTVQRYRSSLDTKKYTLSDGVVKTYSSPVEVTLKKPIKLWGKNLRLGDVVIVHETKLNTNKHLWANVSLPGQWIPVDEYLTGKKIFYSPQTPPQRAPTIVDKVKQVLSPSLQPETLPAPPEPIRVRAHDLVRRTELNGQSGTIMGVREDGSFMVKFDGGGLVDFNKGATASIFESKLTELPESLWTEGTQVRVISDHPNSSVEVSPLIKNKVGVIESIGPDNMPKVALEDGSSYYIFPEFLKFLVVEPKNPPRKIPQKVKIVGSNPYMVSYDNRKGTLEAESEGYGFVSFLGLTPGELVYERNSREHVRIVTINDNKEVTVVQPRTKMEKTVQIENLIPLARYFGPGVPTYLAEANKWPTSAWFELPLVQNLDEGPRALK